LGLDKGKKYGFEVNTWSEACEIEGLGAFLAVEKAVKMSLNL
jgi:hypothetical protein